MGSLNQAMAQLNSLWKSMSVRQRIALVGGALLSVILLLLFTTLIAKPDYKDLYTGMESADVQQLTSKLAAKNIQYKVSPDGKTVSVPADKLDESRLEIASQGMPHTGRLGFELFDKMNWGETSFDEKVNYQRALEGELERTIQTLNGVESARVHLVMPTESVFLDRERQAKASVILKLSTGSLSPDTEQAIASLVAGAVDHLSPESVTVVDADTSRPLGNHKHGGAASDAEQELAARLVNTLAPVLGADHVKASVSVDFDSSTSDESQETYDPKSAVAVATQHSEEQATSGALGGVPGTASNIPGSASRSGNRTNDAGQSSKTESSTYVVNKLIRHTTQPAGRVRRISAALLVDDAVELQQVNGQRLESHRKRTPEELKQISDLAAAAIGIDASRGDSLAVQNLSFERSIDRELPKPTAVQRVRTLLYDWSSIVRYGAILLLFLLAYWLLLRPVKRQFLAAMRPPAAISASDVPSLSSAEATVSEFLDPAAEALHSEGMVIKKQLVQKIKADPAASSRLIQAWIREE